VKYVVWINERIIRRTYLIKNLNTKQYNKFLTIFFEDKKKAEVLIKMKSLLSFNFNLTQCTTKKLIRFHHILKTNNFEYDLYTEKLFDICDHKYITQYNYSKLLCYIKDLNDFEKRILKIRWGPGNHKTIKKNVNAHYVKHPLSNNEKEHWKYILGNVNQHTYELYAINSFYKLKNVIVHTDGVNVFLSGFYNNVFIIGRYCDAVFGISSCYYVESGEKLGRYSGKCFEIIF